MENWNGWREKVSLLEALRAEDWTAVFTLYNGPNYKNSVTKPSSKRMGSPRTDLWSKASRMMPLTLLRPFVKPLILLLICVALVLTFKFVLKSQQKIGALEQALSEKQQQLEQQASRIKSIQTSVSEQQKALLNCRRYKVIYSPNLNSVKLP